VFKLESSCSPTRSSIRRWTLLMRLKPISKAFIAMKFYMLTTLIYGIEKSLNFRQPEIIQDNRCWVFGNFVLSSFKERTDIPASMCSTVQSRSPLEVCFRPRDLFTGRRNRRGPKCRSPFILHLFTRISKPDDLFPAVLLS
jgi:hypothetical protein